MTARARVMGIAGAIVLLASLDALLAWFDVFTPLLSSTRPTSLLASINRQMTDVVRALYRAPAGPPAIVVLGNSETEAVIRPLPAFEEALANAGAPAGTHVVSLCVFATAPTDAEVIARRLGPLRPRLVVVGIAPPDVGTTLERARDMPITRLLDTGFRDGLVPPGDVEARLDRWVRTVWHLYRYRALLHDLLRPPAERRTPGAFLDIVHTPAEIFVMSYGPERAEELLRLQATFAASGRFEDFARYVTELRGPDYLPGLRERWRDLTPQPVQLEALRRLAAHARDAGARPVWLLLPENPLLELDPEVGGEVATRAAEVAAVVRAEAEALGVPVIDLRTAVPPDGFLDLNHLVYSSGRLLPTLAAALAARGLLRAEPEQPAEEERRARDVAGEQDEAKREEVEGREGAERTAERRPLDRAAPRAPEPEDGEPERVIRAPQRVVPGDAVPEAAGEHGGRLSHRLAEKGLPGAA